jgi:hypothetical protein
MVPHGGKIYLLGGSSGNNCQLGGIDFRDVHVLDIESSTWLPDYGIAPCPVRGIGRRHAAVLVGHKIVCIGGSAPSTNDVVVLDLKKKSWEVYKVEGSLSPRVSHTAHLCNNHIFIFGGSLENGTSRGLKILYPSGGGCPDWRQDPEEVAEEAWWF